MNADTYYKNEYGLISKDGTEQWLSCKREHASRIEAGCVNLGVRVVEKNVGGVYVAGTTRIYDNDSKPTVYRQEGGW